MKRAVVIALLMAPFVAHAADKDGNFRIKDFGTESCQRYVAEKSNDSAVYYLSRSWLNGYLTAYNHKIPGTYDAAGDFGIDALAAWLEAYCKANPQSDFITATTALITVLEPVRLQKNPQTIEATAQNQTIRIAQETMQRVQQALKDRGHYQGATDGLFGARTQTALEAFQRAEGLTVTGLPDQVTLLRLILAGRKPPR